MKTACRHRQQIIRLRRKLFLRPRWFFVFLPVDFDILVCNDHCHEPQANRAENAVRPRPPKDPADRPSNPQIGHCTGPISKTTIASMLEIIQLVRSATESPQAIRDKVLQTHQPRLEENEVENAITLAARLWSAS